jgi:septum formation protein
MTNINIFLSYRREDSASQTREIKNVLERAEYNVFMDRSIWPGDVWPIEIENALNNAHVVLAIIGEKWLKCRDESSGRRRIDNENDWVRRELSRALQTNKKVIPVLIYGTRMPSQEDLPEDLKDLSNRKAVKLTEDNWEDDLENLLNKIPSRESHLPVSKPIFLLASESPRRKELLKQIGWEEGFDYFTIHGSVNLGTENEARLNLDQVKKIAEKTARKKINWVIDQHSDIAKKIGREWNWLETIIIGIDTIVLCNGKILDRPLLRSLSHAGPEDIETARKSAKQMLKEQRGGKIHIITSVAVATARDYLDPEIETVVTEAEMRSYSDSEIDDYILYAEPFDKAGALGIQEKGVSLFKKIKGSYTNVVGLPLQEFVSLLEEKYKNTFSLPELKSSLKTKGANKDEIKFSVVCVGDINYDYIYDKLPQGFFPKLLPPGQKIIGPIHRAVGGTAVNFAKSAKKIGFKDCFVVGAIGGDALGDEIRKELNVYDIDPIDIREPSEKTSIAIILRDRSGEDTSITLTDSHQSLPDPVVDKARAKIRDSDVFYCSGYCLIDPNREAGALKLLQAARESKRLVVLDVVVGMSDNKKSFDELTSKLTNQKSRTLVDILVSELPEIFRWFRIETDQKTELELWDLNKSVLIRQLRKKFPVTILRTSKYTDEIIITPDDVLGPQTLEYGSLEAREKVGYGDRRTAKQIYSLLSPRIVLASQSPQRVNLLCQIIAPSKIQVVVSTCTEAKIPDETSYDRVKRLAKEKAEDVFRQGEYHDDIELIIGADTEIIRKGENDKWEMIEHPQNVNEAIQELTKLSGRTHKAITGIAIIGKDPQTGQIKTIVEYVETEVTFADLTPEQIKIYAETKEPLGRAGAYAIQGLGAMLAKNLEGSYSNVVGLPLERLSGILAEEFNKPIWKFDKVSSWSFPSPIKELRQS